MRSRPQGSRAPPAARLATATEHAPPGAAPVKPSRRRERGVKRGPDAVTVRGYLSSPLRPDFFVYRCFTIAVSFHSNFFPQTARWRGCRWRGREVMHRFLSRAIFNRAKNGIGGAGCPIPRSEGGRRGTDRVGTPRNDPESRKCHTTCFLFHLLRAMLLYIFHVEEV